MSKGTTAVFDVGSEEPQGEEGCGQRAGNGDAGLLYVREGELGVGHDHGAVSFADAAAAGHQGVVVLEVGVGVEGDGGDIIEGFVDGLVVEGLDVGQYVGELIAGDPDLVGGKAVEHECVVGVGAVGDTDLLICGLRGGHDAVYLWELVGQWGDAPERSLQA